ncbi:hypothetical protein MSIM_53870 [Mycobacterium simiae]|nr:hypothetical protein MSIM_53870 [Mycobacterium simiae]
MARAVAQSAALPPGGMSSSQVETAMVIAKAAIATNRRAGRTEWVMAALNAELS